MRSILTATVVAFVSFSLAGCPNPTANKPRAEVEAPVEEAPAKPDQDEAPASVYVVSGLGSRIDFVGAKVTGQHDGGFKTFEGRITVPGSKVEEASIELEIDMGSLWTDAEKLTGHLKSVDFFEAEKFPRAKFVSTSIEKSGEEGATHSITGNLSLRGVEKSITFPASIELSDGGVKASSEFALDRQLFGINFPGMPDDLIKDDVLVKLSINAKPE
ncbi:MAG: YceI family protein [Deltaproteobacteria bacterium]|nr:YceI family protein [Deltaproteobacteria bacterium]